MDLLHELGSRVRAARQARGWSQAELSRRAGVSARFLVDLESGAGNISVLRLAEVAQAVEVSLAALLGGLGPVADEADALASLSPEQRRRALAAVGGGRKVALVGLRGAGKSTVGPLLAERLGAAFVEVDAEVEARAGMQLGEIFEYHGAARYRELEREVLEGLLARPEPLVLATGGSLVTAGETWEWLRGHARSVWLRASPEAHLARVAAQGDHRPMRGRPDALAELRGILAAREPLYGQAALRVDTDARDPGRVVEEIAAGL